MSYSVPEWAMFLALILGVAIGIAFGIFMSKLAVDELRSACETKHFGYECRVSAMPIDPFHPEEN